MQFDRGERRFNCVTAPIGLPRRKRTWWFDWVLPDHSVQGEQCVPFDQRDIVFPISGKMDLTSG